MSTIILKRQREFANMFRKIQVELNGNLIANLSYKEQISIEVPSGQNTLKAKIDWCGSQPFIIDLNENESKQVIIKSPLFIKYSGILIFAIIILHIILANTLNFNYLVILLVPFLFTSLYYITFGRNHFLQISTSLF